MSVLENVLQALSTLPSITNKNLKHIKNLDHQIKDLSLDTDLMEKKYMKRTKNKTYFLLKKKENKKLLSNIKSTRKKIVKLSKDKIDTANKIYEDIDKNIESMDEKLRHMEEELNHNLEQILAEKSTMQHDSISFRKKKKKEIKIFKKQKASKNSQGDQQKVLLNHTLNQVDNLLKPIEWEIPVNTNEPKYCFCNRFSFGEMLACDNPYCEKEWFHFECVGIIVKPKGKWFCKECSENIHKKNNI